jgi:hypothetical protein
MKIKVWLNADGGNSIYETIDLSDDATEEEIEKEAREVIFNKVDWGWYPTEEDGE